MKYLSACALTVAIIALFAAMKVYDVSPERGWAGFAVSGLVLGVALVAALLEIAVRIDRGVSNGC